MLLLLVLFWDTYSQVSRSIAHHVLDSSKVFVGFKYFLN